MTRHPAAPGAGPRARRARAVHLLTAAASLLALAALAACGGSVPTLGAVTTAPAGGSGGGDGGDGGGLGGGPQQVDMGDGVVIQVVGSASPATHSSVGLSQPYWSTSGPSLCSFTVVDQAGHTVVRAVQGAVPCSVEQMSAADIPQDEQAQRILDDVCAVMEQLGWSQAGLRDQDVWWSMTFAR